MAEILVDPEVRATVARKLLELVDNPDDVRGTHGPEGWVFLVSDEVAHKLYLAHLEDSP